MIIIWTQINAAKHGLFKKYGVKILNSVIMYLQKPVSSLDWHLKL